MEDKANEDFDNAVEINPKVAELVAKLKNEG